MPIIKSAKKRVRVANKAAIRNSKTKRNLKNAIKAFSAKPSTKTHADAQSNIDRAVKKGILHKNKAARLKKKAANKAKDNNVTLKAKAAPKKSATTTKPVAKKKATPKTTPKPTTKTKK